MKTYFAYGSNLNERRFKARISSAQFKSRATLARYRLVFEKPSKDGSGKATIVHDDKSVVEGAIFTYADADHGALKKFEGGYSESPVTVTTDAGEVSVQTFVADRHDPALKPFDWYVQHIVVGGRKLGLPEKYLEVLAAVPSAKDSDAERVATEQAFLK
jgi:gamma-glutamylcyclotransferase